MKRWIITLFDKIKFTYFIFKYTDWPEQDYDIPVDIYEKMFSLEMKTGFPPS